MFWTSAVLAFAALTLLLVNWLRDGYLGLTVLTVSTVLLVIGGLGMVFSQR